MMLISGRATSPNVAYNVVDLPEPVGPVTNTMPYGRLYALENTSKLRSLKFRSSTLRLPEGVLKIRMTIFSPHTVGNAATINLLTVGTYGNTAILRLAALADIHFGHDLNAADHTLGHGAWRFLEDMQHAVDAVAYEQTVFLRFDMDIGAVVVDGLVDEQTYEACHGGGVFAVVLFKVDFFFRGRGDLVR